MDQMLADCPDNWREEIFVSRRPIIPWLRVKEFKIVTLKMIVSSMLLHQSKIERKLQARSFKHIHAIPAAARHTNCAPPPYSRCEWLPTAATVAPAVSAQGIQLAGPLYRRLPTTGMYKRVEAVIEGATLCCGTSGALPSALPSVVLSGSNVERLEENRAKLEFTLLTKKNGSEHGRVYAFRASTCANAKYGNVCD
eukprot:scaffold35287_cov63-Phaeocystis_antarctica.AAC.3